MQYQVMSDVLFNIFYFGLLMWAGCCLMQAVCSLFHVKVAALQRVTLPAVTLVGLVTPSIVPQSFHTVLAAIWLLTVRVAFYLAGITYGFLPGITA